MKLTISIVNWNVKEYLEECLDSVFRYSEGISLEVIVVDNASSDGSADMVKNKFPQVIIIENAENIGFGNAHNQVIPMAKGEYMLFLEPDTEMLPDTLSRMLDFMDVHPEAGVSACREIPVKQELKSEFINVPHVQYLLYLCSKMIYSKFPNPFTMRIYMNAIEAALKESETPSLEEGFFLARVKALRQVKGFNPKFFHGGDSTDLTKRIRKRGWKLYYVPMVKVIHYGCRSSAQLSDVEFNALMDNWRKRG